MTKAKLHREDSPENLKESSTACKKKKAEKATKSKPPLVSKTVKNKTPLLEFPRFLRIIGPKHVQIMMQFMPSALIYGVTSMILGVYMTEWRAVLQYLPYYNGKYVDKVEPVKSLNEDEEKAEEDT